MTLSVVIPTRNRMRSVRSVIDALLTDPGASEIVVVDDGSMDDTPPMLAALAEREPRIRIVRAEGVGAATARQLGVERSSGHIVLMLDDDVVPGAGLASGHLARHDMAAGTSTESSRLVVVGYMPTAIPTRRARGGFATRFYALEYQRHVDRWSRGDLDILTSLWAGNLSLPRQLCIDVGVASADFPPTNHQDRDFGIRLSKLGARAVFDPALRAAHAHDRPLDAFLRDAFRQGVGRWHLHRLHADVIGPGSLDDTTSGLPNPLRALVQACDRATVRRPTAAALRVAIWISGGLRLFWVEDQAARLSRRIALRDGFLTARTATEALDPRSGGGHSEFTQREAHGPS